MTSTSHDPPDGVLIREATADDLSAVVPVFDAYRAFYGAPGDAAAAHAFLEARQLRGESILVVAFHPAAPTDAIMGFAQLYPCFSSIALRRVYILNDLFVVPEWRRARVGHRLIQYAASCAAARGAIRLELATQLTNDPARRLYEAMGFVPDLEFAHMSLALPLSGHAGSRLG